MSTFKNRITNNSEYLKKEFGEIYREFFSHCSLVVSAPGSFYWSGEFSGLYGGLMISQKLPLRFYIGLETINKKIIEFGSFQAYIPSDKEIKEWMMEMPMINKVVNFLNKEFSVRDKPFGVRYHVLTEIPPGSGLNSSGAHAAALAAALKLYYSSLKPADIQKWNSVSVEKLTSDQRYKFNQSFRLAWKLNSIFHGGSSSASGVISPMISSSLPILSCSEKRIGIEKNDSGSYSPLAISDNYQILDEAQYWSSRLEEFLNLGDGVYLPLDFGLIYSGDIRLTESVIRSIRARMDHLGKVLETAKQDISFGDNRPDLVRQSFKRFTREQEPEKGSRLWEKYMDSLSAVSLEILYYFKEFAATGFSDNTLRGFLKAINRNQDLLRAIDVSSPSLNFICNHLNWSFVKLKDEYGVGTKITGSGKRGDILFVCNFHACRDNIERIIQEMRDVSGENIYLDYASWLDGTENEGVKIEQFLKEKIYSPFITQKTAQVKYMASDSSYSILYSLEELEKKKKNIDLLVDPVDKEIFIRGKKLSSKELHSKAATIEIIQVLLKGPKGVINNEELPSSCYRSNRNELQSKIISPLTKTFRRLTKKSLPLKVKGGLTKFKLELKLDELDICFIERVF